MRSWVRRLLLVLVPLLGHYYVASDSTSIVDWTDRERYYYPDLRVKLSELLMGQQECIEKAVIGGDNDDRVPSSGDITKISSFPVEKRSPGLLEWWKSMEPPKQIRVEPFLCEDVNSKRHPIWKSMGCQLKHYMNPSAPRCQTKYLKYICDNSQLDVDIERGNGFILPESNHAKTEKPPQPYLVTTRNAIVSMCGDLSMPCGYLHTTANCMATGFRWQAQQFHKKCPQSILVPGALNYSCLPGTPWSRDVVRYKRVFVVNEVDDTYVYHIHVEIMARIVYHLDFLQANPDVKIMFGCDSKKKSYITQAGLQHGLQSIRPFLELVGLREDRLVVHQHVFAEEVYLPMEGGCQDPVYQTWHVLHMRREYMQRAGLQWDAKIDKGTRSARPIMLVLKRSSNAKHTRNGHDSVRQWSDNFANRLVRDLQKAIPSYNVKLFSDKNTTMMSCHACQVRAFHEAEVVVGMHGAGLSNMIYMKPTSAVVEFAPYTNDARCLPGGGPFSRLAAVMSHNYMMHHPRQVEYSWTAGRTSEFNISRFTTHIRSFLKSINFVR
jgi:hypothetical protein